MWPRRERGSWLSGVLGVLFWAAVGGCAGTDKDDDTASGDPGLDAGSAEAAGQARMTDTQSRDSGRPDSATSKADASPADSSPTNSIKLDARAGGTPRCKTNAD